jgi:DNA-binding phage protein
MGRKIARNKLQPFDAARELTSAYEQTLFLDLGRETGDMAYIARAKMTVLRARALMPPRPNKKFKAPLGGL